MGTQYQSFNKTIFIPYTKAVDLFIVIKISPRLPLRLLFYILCLSIAVLYYMYQIYMFQTLTYRLYIKYYRS